MYKINGIPAVMGGRQIHPSLYDRMLAAGVTPDFPRPEKPALKMMWLGMIISLLLTIGMSLGWMTGAKLLRGSDTNSQHSIQTKIILEGGNAMDLVTIGWIAVDADQFADAGRWFRQAVISAPADYKVVTSAAYGYALIGDCNNSGIHMQSAAKLFKNASAKDQ